MMRCLREVNVDNNTVGWYQSSSFGTYQTTEMIETFVSYHESIKKCVCLVYDPQRSARGQLALKAVRLKDAFIAHFKEQKLTGGQGRREGVRQKGFHTFRGAACSSERFPVVAFVGVNDGCA
jgi:translation initiation factor 3 subunit H